MTWRNPCALPASRNIDFAHQLRGPIGRGRHAGIVLAHRHALGISVDRRGRGEDEIAHPRFDRGLDQGAGVDRVVAVVASGSRTESGTTIEATKCIMASIRCAAMSAPTRDWSPASSAM